MLNANTTATMQRRLKNSTESLRETWIESHEKSKGVASKNVAEDCKNSGYLVSNCTKTQDIPTKHTIKNITCQKGCRALNFLINVNIKNAKTATYKSLNKIDAITVKCKICNTWRTHKRTAMVQKI